MLPRSSSFFDLWKPGVCSNMPASSPCPCRAPPLPVWRGIAWLSRPSTSKHANQTRLARCQTDGQLSNPTERPLLSGTTTLRNCPWPLTARVACSCQSKRQHPPSVRPGRMAETARTSQQTSQQAGVGHVVRVPATLPFHHPAIRSGKRPQPADHVGLPQMSADAPSNRPIWPSPIWPHRALQSPGRMHPHSQTRRSRRVGRQEQRIDSRRLQITAGLFFATCICQNS